MIVINHDNILIAKRFHDILYNTFRKEDVVIKIVVKDLDGKLIQLNNGYQIIKDLSLVHEINKILNKSLSLFLIKVEIKKFNYDLQVRITSSVDLLVNYFNIDKESNFYFEGDIKIMEFLFKKP